MPIPENMTPPIPEIMAGWTRRQNHEGQTPEEPPADSGKYDASHSGNYGGLDKEAKP
jgi:hypothetical protein